MSNDWSRPAAVSVGLPQQSSAICLVTGGLGFLGRHIVRRLVREGYFVRVLDPNASCQSPGEINGQVEMIRGTVCDRLQGIGSQGNVKACLVVGHNGFFENHLVAALARKGYGVCALDRRPRRRE